MNVRIPYGRHFVDEEDIQAVVDVMRHGWLTQGPKIAEFEEAVARYVGARYAVAASSGTAALHMACAAAGVGQGDIVVTSPNTFVASANCALYVGAKPEFADIDPETLNIDPVALQQRCEELANVKAIIPVHIAGLPCDMPSIKRLADAMHAVVIEDASHALGATDPLGNRVGSCAHSDMSVFSFHPVKAITTGEGGMVTTNNETLYRDLLRLRSHGINKLDDKFVNPNQAFTNGEQNRWYYEMLEVGFNYRITDIQCALGLSQLRKLDRFVKRRRELVLRYDHLLSEIRHISPTQRAGREHSAHHLYIVRIDFPAAGRTRASLMRELFADGIVSQVHYIPVHLHPYYRANGHATDHFPVAEKYYARALSLPLYYELSDSEQDFVVSQLRRLVG